MKLFNEIQVPELDDFHLTLGELDQIVQKLIAQHGKQAIIFSDAGYNNVSVSIDPNSVKK